jgi:hypothetical protein
MTSVQSSRVELRQSRSNALQLPMFIGVIVIAIVLRQVLGSSPSPIVIAVCAAAIALNLVFVSYLLRNIGTLVVTADDITFTRGHRDGGDDRGPSQVIQRAAGSTLSFRVARNGPMGSKYTGYVRKLRDNATGHEVFAGAFDRRQVQQACESQGWSFTSS